MKQYATDTTRMIARDIRAAMTREKKVKKFSK
jgi:hypothetical protein